MLIVTLCLDFVRVGCVMCLNILFGYVSFVLLIARCLLCLCGECICFVLLLCVMWFNSVVYFFILILLFVWFWYCCYCCLFSCLLVVFGCFCVVCLFRARV